MESNPSPTRVVRAVVSDVNRLVPLFDAYRQFYHRPSNRLAARDFLSRRLTQNESVIFIAEDAGIAVGFVQLYPVFSSLAMEPWWILNDLYVVPQARGKGFASLLLKQAKALALETGAAGLSLETAPDNPARQLYERHGWRRQDAFLHYELHLGSAPP